MRQLWMVALGSLALVAGACFQTHRAPGAAGSDDGNATAVGNPSSPTDPGAPDGRAVPPDATSPGQPSATPTPVCSTAPDTVQFSAAVVDKVDLLFVVDNSGSMREEQQALREQFPRIVRALTTGDIDGDGVNDFPPARDIHLGVVSSDMGLVGIQSIPGCAGLGDDGILNNVPDPALRNCQAIYPRFLTYTSGVDDPERVATDFGCLASLGTDGCGFEQQLEAGLKALWPSVDIDPRTGEVYQPNRITFLGDVNGFGQLGHGDLENAGFLRNDPVQGVSLIAIVVVTDEEDCSSQDTRHFTPDIYLDPADPLIDQDLNLRCFYNPQNLYALERYSNAFRALRPGNEQLVLFGAIAGVPPELVDEERLRGVDLDDAGERERFYEGILGHPQMVQRVDQSLTPEEGGNLVPSCITDSGRAYPPRRIVELARRFGENGFVGSICQADLSFPIEMLLRRTGRNLGAACLPQPLRRDSDGRVDCEVHWHLPPPSRAPAGVPTSCFERPFLQPASSGPRESELGGPICMVRQLAVRGEVPEPGQGWYYDDFSEETVTLCRGDFDQRVAFTPDAQPHVGVALRLRCQQDLGPIASCE